MERSHLTLEEICRLLPSLEELEQLRLCIAGASTPDPTKQWDRSRTYATLDKRVISLEQIERVVREAEEALHDHVDTIFSAVRPVLRTFWAGQDATAAHQLIEMGERQEQTGHYRKARQCYEAALTLSLPLSEKAPQIVALRRIARVERAVGDLNEALLYYRRSAELACDTEDVQGEVIARTGCGNVLAVQGQWTEAEECYQSALSRLLKAPEPESLRLERAQLYNNLALIATRQARFPEAETWLEQALDLWNAVASPADLAICYHVHGTLRTMQGRREEAREFFRRALELSIPSAVRAVILIDLADCYLADGFVSEAERHGREAEQHAIAACSPYSLGEMYRGLGNIARAQGDEDGFTFYEKALEIGREKRYPVLEGETLMDYALLRARSDGQEEAQAYLQRAREIFLKLGAVHEQARAEQALRELARPDEASAAAD